MPGKYLEFIKCGRYAVPVELSFLPWTYQDIITTSTITTSKWVEKSHWKEIKAMLRPAVESVSKAHETGSGKVTTSHHVAHGVDVSFGYIIDLSKDKCNFLAVLDPQKNCWTDDEEEQENVLMDLGGRHQNLTPTDWYVKAVVLKRSFSTVEDAKRVRKELGIKPDDVRNFLSTSNSEKNTKGPVNEDDKDSSNSLGETSEEDNEDDDDDDGPSTETESLMEIPPPSGKILQPTLPLNQVNNTGFVSLRPSCFRGNTPRQNDVIDEASLRRLYRQCSPPGDHCDFWNDDIEDSDDEELPDIEEFSSVVAFSKEKKKGKSKSTRKRGGSPHKHRCAETGLPDIDDGKLSTKSHSSRSVGANSNGSANGGNGNGGSGNGSTSGKRKRTVAIVEPMKPVNPEESHSETRKRKARNLNFSPTFGFISRASHSKNSAIEILQEDSELLPIPGYPPAFSKRKPENNSNNNSPSVRRHKRKKRSPRTDQSPNHKSSSEEDGESERTAASERSTTTTIERFTERSDPGPSPSSISAAAGTHDPSNIHRESDVSSEPEMPLLDRMVSTSDEEEHVRAREQNTTTRLITTDPLNHILELEEVIRISQETTQVISDIENNASSESEHPPDPINTIINASTSTATTPSMQIPASNPMPSKKRTKKRVTKLPEEESRHIRQLSPDMSTLGVGVKRSRRPAPTAASDSDDITSESAYRKKPLKKRKKKKRSEVNSVMQVPQSSSSSFLRTPYSSNSNTGDAQTQTVFSPTRQNTQESSSSKNKRNSNYMDETLVIVSKRERMDYDHDYTGTKTKALATSAAAAASAFSDSENDDILYEGEIQSTLYLPALGSPEEGGEALDLFNFETIVPNPLYNQEPPLIKLSPDGCGNGDEEEDEEDEDEDEEDNDAIPLVSLLLNDDQNDIEFERHLATHEDQDDDSDDEISSLIVEMDPSLDYTFDIANNLAKRAKDKPIPDPILRRALQLNASDDSDEHNDDNEDSPAASTSNPKEMSTFALMTNPNTLKASLSLFEQLKIAEPNQENKDKELMPPPLIRRPSSPDICSLNPEERIKRPKLKKQGPPKIRPDSPQPSTSKQMYQVQDPLLQEYLCRVDQAENMEENDYEPSGDQFDLSQRSLCMLPVVSNYATKSRMYKIHSKNIRDLTHEDIKEEFDQIKPQIRGIFEGSYPSQRNKIFCEKKNKQDSIQTLESMALRYSPFENNQVGWLISLINEYLVPMPGSRIKYVDYIKHVMIPEACIRIYSHVNEISWERSETEMTCGAFYQDDELLDS